MAATKWEYKIDSFESSTLLHTGELGNRLNKLGNDGWELASLALPSAVFVNSIWPTSMLSFGPPPGLTLSLARPERSPARP